MGYAACFGSGVIEKETIITRYAIADGYKYGWLIGKAVHYITKSVYKKLSHLMIWNAKLIRVIFLMSSGIV